MIYLDNAATGGFKPSCVLETAFNTAKYLSANPGRSGHRLSVIGAETVYNCRKSIAELFDGSTERVIFTKNCTEALNIAILGTLKKGGHIVTTVYEHNSVLRPLYALREKGLITFDAVSEDEKNSLTDAIKEKINLSTYAVIVTAASNVTGKALPLKEIGEIAKANNLLFIVDGAQGAGHIELNIKEQNISALCCSGHKGLYGLMGSGALVFSDSVNIEPTYYGGTGTDSNDLNQPQFYPERLESGTLNLPAIAALGEAVRYVKQNFSSFGTLLFKMTAQLIKDLKKLPLVKCYSLPNCSGIVSFEIKGLSSAFVADRLDKDFDIAVRSGLHCAPLIHKTLGTDKDGLIRVGLAVQNTAKEIDALLDAVKNIVAF